MSKWIDGEFGRYHSFDEYLWIYGGDEPACFSTCLHSRPDPGTVIEATFEPLVDYKVEIEIEVAEALSDPDVGDEAKCPGYITSPGVGILSPANLRRTVSAAVAANPGYVFREWQGEGVDDQGVAVAGQIDREIMLPGTWTAR